MKTLLLAAPAGLLFLSACAASGDGYPSLAPRAIEQRGEEVVETPLPPPAPADATMGAQIAALLAEARRGDADFTALIEESRRAVSAAKGSGEGSERWLTAQQMLSALDAARQPTAAAMTALDSLYVELAARVTADASVGGLTESEAAHAEVQAIYDRQIAQLAALRDSLEAS